ncbi:glycoside hydrolase family 16 protein [Brachyspira intermedia]|uniref:glycoside hydrolase family 16 protein n=1 Tax=Brachyspira intermedia TaxID=84377 RepID=UPI003004E94E
MKKIFIYISIFSFILSAGILVISCNKAASGSTGPTGNPIFKSIVVQDKYIVVNFKESGFTGSKIEFRAKGKITADTANAGKDITVQITSPSQKVNVNPGSGYDITIVDLTSGAEKILYQKSDITTYLFYEEFSINEPLPANAQQAENLEPWKGKWVAAWKGKSAWNHAMNGSFRNLELKKDGNIEYLHMRGTKTGDDDSTSKGSGMQTTHLYGTHEAPEDSKRREPFFFTYGKVEFRARIESQVGKQKKGPFPALWLMPARGDDQQRPLWREWAAGGEIDVMEYVWGDPNNVDQTIHVGHDPDEYKGGKGGKAAVANINDWHTYTLEWTKEGLYWYVDGQKGREPYLKAGKSVVDYPFLDKSAFYMIINVGVGRSHSNNGGEDGYAGGAQAGLDTWMDVDWVKVMPNKDTILDNSRGANGCEYYRDVQW